MVLFVDACVRPNSRTRELAQCLLEKTAEPVEKVELYGMSLPAMDMEMLAKRDQAAKTQDYSDPVFDMAKQFARADEIVIAAPYWDLLFPAALRAYLEAVSVTNLTFRYTPQGFPQGLCKAKRLCYVTTAGGYLGENNFGYQYVSALAKGLFGIENTLCVSAEGLDIVGNDSRLILEQAKQRLP